MTVFAAIVTAFSEPALFWSALPVIGVMIVIMGVLWWLPRIQARTLWKYTPAFHEPISGRITPEAIYINGTQFANEISWEMYREYKQTSDLLVLYQAPNVFNIFLRTFFEHEADWLAFNDLASEKITRDGPSKGKGRGYSIAIVVACAIILIISFISGLR